MTESSDSHSHHSVINEQQPCSPSVCNKISSIRKTRRFPACIVNKEISCQKLKFIQKYSMTHDVTHVQRKINNFESRFKSFH